MNYLLANKTNNIMKNVSNKLRVVHFPQIGSCKASFKVEVKDEEQANLMVNALANQHLWLFENQIIPDYSNTIFVEMFDETIDSETGEPYGWCDYFNDEECMEWDEVVENYFSK